MFLNEKDGEGGMMEQLELPNTCLVILVTRE